MPLALLLSLQAAAAPAPPSAPVDFDLAKYRPSPPEGCGAAIGAEIVVCGRRPRQSLNPDPELARRYQTAPVKAEIGIGGGAVARSFVESVEMPRGAVSKRLMIGIKLPF